MRARKITNGRVTTEINPLYRIIKATGKSLVQCKCRLCKEQCHTPCLGTPQDIEALIDAGYAGRLEPTQWYAGMLLGVTDRVIYLLQSRLEKNGWCTFYKDGLCKLHNLGLKPTEGKLSTHKTNMANWKPGKSIAWNVAKEWINPMNEACLERIHDKIVKLENEL